MDSILDTIVAQKRLEIAQLYQQHDLSVLRTSVSATAKSFYSRLAAARAQQSPFFICEFKRRSPSEGWINEHADVRQQVAQYVQAGAGAVSVLTDAQFFGGSYNDLRAAASVLADTPVCLLQKDFVLDPIQIYLARQAGADLILLIAAILSAEELESLRQIAEILGMGTLVEVHDGDELEKVRHLPFPVLGVNNRDLKTFRTSLNRVNVLKRQAGNRLIVAESGIRDHRDFQVVATADAFLIGTSLMQQPATLALVQHGRKALKPLLKACGIRTAEALTHPDADFVGINFSPVSKRRMPTELLDRIALPDHAVALFYQNTADEIRATLAKYPFKRVQLYAGDVSPDFVRSLRVKVILAARIRNEADLTALEAYAADVDFFILDGPMPGSGQRIEASIPLDFPYPFLLAGGIGEENAAECHQFAQCMGVDVASGIEIDGVVCLDKITALKNAITA